MNTDLVCFSHLRWRFVYQRPQHLMSRFARQGRVFFIEEPVYHPGEAFLEVTEDESCVFRVVPFLPEALQGEGEIETAALRSLLDAFFQERHIQDFVAWYYSPMFLSYTAHLQPKSVIYDCMDELAAFKNAPQALKDFEQELFRRSHLVFTGGRSLYEAKKEVHPQVHCFPSSIDFDHFATARQLTPEPEDQKAIPHPRLGFFGVIDERMDLELIAALADARPDWHLVLIGPIVKIDPESLPQRPNIHYLDMKTYAELPSYLAGWDVALLPFAQNESTRFISPTKTPEYLAGGKPVVSTPIADVVQPYGELGLAKIAANATEFQAAIEAILSSQQDRETWLAQVDRFLASDSWDHTWGRMNALIEQSLGQP